MATIAVIAFDEMHLFHLAVPLEVFGAYQSDVGVPRHQLLVVAGEPGRLHGDAGTVLDAPYGLAALAEADVVIVPSWRDSGEATPPEDLLHALRAAHRRGALVVGLCTGTFVLAAAGLLDGRRATTHWRHAERLAERYPAITVDPSVLYVDAGDVLTSAGSAASIDLCLHVLRRLHGAETANAVARRMVVPPHRSGGQAQYIESPVPTASEDDRLAATLRWALEHLDEPLDVDMLAARASMSRRSFTRHVRAALGTTPLQWLIAQRVLLAQRLLETTDLPVEEVARRCGFGSAVAFREHFRRTVGTSPRAYRAAFSTAAA